MGQLEAIKTICSLIGDKDLVVGNMNMNTWCIQGLIGDAQPRRTPRNLLFGIDMGFCTATALGLALALPHRRVVAVDGDGGILMKLAIFADMAEANPPNLTVVVIDNESFGGSSAVPTRTATVADLAAIAKASGVKNTVTVKTVNELRHEFSKALENSEPSVIVAKVELKPEEKNIIFDERHWVDVEWESSFIRSIEETEGITIIPATRMSSSH